MARDTKDQPAVGGKGRGIGLDRALRGLVMAAGALAVLAMVSSSSVRHPQNAGAIVWTLWYSGIPALLYLAGSIGWGMGAVWVLRRVLGTSPAADVPVLVVGLGVSVMLTISHGLGVLGALGGAWGISGRWWAYLPVALGGAVAVIPALVALQRGVDGEALLAPLGWTGRVSVAAAWVCGASVLVVAACNPPGTLWASEFGGYDALSYHLQLPREWLAAGRVWPVHHNVYSFLPSYVESAFTHLGAMTGSRDLLVDDGRVLLSCHLLCAGFTVLAAWCVGRVARAAARAVGVSWPAAEVASSAGAAAAITLPWLVVVGSIAYNESAMVLLIAAASAVALGEVQHASGPAGAVRGLLLRGALCGWIVGVACGAKPTALILGAPIVGMFLVWGVPARTWWAAAVGACAAGLVALLPWMARNWIESGNPVFPQFASLLGAGHWSADQIDRYAAAHRFDGGIARRLALIALPDETDPAGPRHRGMAHAQWGLFFPAAAAAIACLAAMRPSRRIALLLGGAAIVQIAAWLLLTHIQSRFLLPLIVPGVAAIGTLIGIAADRCSPKSERSAPAWPKWSGLFLAAGLWALAPAGAYLVHRYLLEGPPGGGPNTLLELGPGALSGTIGRASYDLMTDDERREFLSEAATTVYCNFTSRPDDLLYLVGEATPLYYTARVLYNTTYDAWPLGEAVRAAPDNPGRWIDDLLERGVTRVLVNVPELDRLARSGWSDPMVTGDVLERSIGRFGQIERSWNNGELVLYRIR